jgi:Tubulin like
MASNHLLIGLGGTGGKILRSFRKTIFQNFRSEDPKGVNVRYLYVDSSDEMMKHDDPTWRILGQSVQLKKTSQLMISGLNLAQVLDNVGNYPGISPWIGGKEQFRNILTSANAANVVGGQKRRLGRFLFACMAGKFREQVQALVKEMETGGTASVTFHVCCGLAGGTGSGSLVDVISQIRAMYPGKTYRILVYAFLPDKNPGANRAGLNYHANGYAALLELNALSLGVYQPHDVSGGQKGRLELQDPFHCCYLFTDENEDHNKVDIDKELPDIVASFLYQKMVAANDMVWDSLRRLETFENMDFRPEESPFSHRPERSRLFFAFGIKQIAYPEEEIREYMTYAFARQAALQLQYNRWSDSFGYIEEPVNQSFSEFVKQKETLQRWYLTDDHLMLSDGILPDEVKNKRWKPISTFWSDLLPNFKSFVRESFPKNDNVWLDELSKLCETAYGQNYRDLGVRKFYETKRGEIKDHVRELRQIIERDLFQDWVAGAKSMNDISRLLIALISSLEERASAVDERIPKIKENEEAAAAKVAFNKKEWAKVGVFSGMMGKRQSLLDAQGECLQQLYVFRTRIEGMEFSKRLLQFLIAELTTLSGEVSKCASMITEALRDFNAGIEERCADSGQEDLRKQIIRFYKPDAVKDFTKALVRDKTEQQKQTNAVRSALVKLLGDSQNFANFNTKIGKEKFVSVLEIACEQNALEAHNTHVAASPDRSRILNVSVVERLFREYSGNPEALRTYIINVVSHAKNYFCFNDAEVKRMGPGTLQGGMVSYLSIILPEATDFAEFREQLRTEFRNATPGAKDDVVSREKPNEITLVNLTNLFPARFGADVSFLKERYDRRLESSDAAQAKMELHIEGDGSGLPSLYVPEVEPKKYLAYLMIGKSMNVIQSLENPDTGITSLYLLTRNEKGRENEPIELGKDFAAALENANLISYDALGGAVDMALHSDYLHRLKREELQAGVNAQVDQVRAERKNPLDRTYKAFVAAADVASTMLTPG